jgi:ornithine cyclodeaminase/alanine dehydrogenase-like protein (mu-crystallin family)
MVLLLSNQDIEKVLRIEDCMNAIEDAYRDLADGQAANFPEGGRMEVHTPVAGTELNRAYTWGAMAGLVRSAGVMALRMKSDITYDLRHPEGLLTQEKYCIEPGTYCGLILLFNIHTGEPLAILNDGLIQHMRVAATSGVAAKYLARNDSENLGILGSGGMARTHAEALCAVRPIKRIRVFSPTRANREKFAQEMRGKLDLDVQSVNSPELAVEGAHIISACTDSKLPVVEEKWVKPGMYLTRVLPAEFGPWIESKADVIIRHLKAQPSGGPVRVSAGQDAEGSRRDRERLPSVAYRELPTLADLVSGKTQGRSDASQITFYYNSPGSGIQFAAAGAKAYQLARVNSVGRELPSTWFLQDIRD